MSPGDAAPGGSGAPGASQPGVFQITLKVFLRRGDEFLVLRDAKAGVGDLPGGRFNPGEIYEPWVDSVRRELSEELGDGFEFVIANGGEPVFIFPHFIQESGYEGLGIAYVADFVGGELRLSAEHDAMRWVSVKDWDASEWFATHLLGAVQRFQREAG